MRATGPPTNTPRALPSLAWLAYLALVLLGMALGVLVMVVVQLVGAL